MAQRPCTLRQRLTSAIKAMRATGIDVVRVDINLKDGNFSIITKEETAQNPADILDRELAEFETRHGQG